jgi:hypothetical protein
MNLAVCTALARGPETRVWYRAIEAQFWPTALQTVHSKDFATRYNAGARAVTPFEIIYLGEDHQVALYEVRAIYGPPFPKAGAVVLPNPQQAWLILNVRVTLQQVVDLTPVAAQTVLETTVQELTGDWQGYYERQPHDSVPQPVGIAPTQALGQALVALPGLEGFRTVSARLPSRMVLVVFPQKLLPGSVIEFTDGAGHIHRIEPPPKKRRRAR